MRARSHVRSTEHGWRKVVERRVLLAADHPYLWCSVLMLLLSPTGRWRCEHLGKCVGRSITSSAPRARAPRCFRIGAAACCLRQSSVARVSYGSIAWRGVHSRGGAPCLLVSVLDGWWVFASVRSEDGLIVRKRRAFDFGMMISPSRLIDRLLVTAYVHEFVCVRSLPPFFIPLLASRGRQVG